MSWNDQGNNNGSRDPWGRNNNPPPDIDELIKKFRAQINSIFGGGSGDGGGGIKKILPSVLIAVALLYSAFGIYTVDAQEEAVILRFGKYSTTKGPGFIGTLHLLITDLLLIPKNCSRTLPILQCLQKTKT